MGFAGGSITFKRFFVNGRNVNQVDEALLDQLAARAMGKDPIQTADRTEVGWVTGEHILDTEFDFAKNVIADGLHFALRIDTNKTPNDLVRSYQRMNEKAMLEASGREHLSKVERREAREQAKARADKESASGMHRRMKQIPVFWDLLRKEVYFGATGATTADHLMMLFRGTFDLPLTPASAGEMAARHSAAIGETRPFDDCVPAHFVNPPEGVEAAIESSRFMESAGKDFLGTEWLTWLWYTSHVESSDLMTGLGESVTVLFDKSLQLECAFKLSGSTENTADGPTRLPEASVAMSNGKRPVRVGLQLAIHGELFSFGIRGDGMHYGSVQLPPIEDASDARVVFEERISRLRDLIDTVGATYTLFLKRRLSSKWQQTLNAMRTWIAGGRSAASNIEEPVPVAG